MVTALPKRARTLVLARSLMAGGAEKQAILITRVLNEMGGSQLLCLHDQVHDRMRRIADEQGVEAIFLRGSRPQKILQLRSHIRRLGTQLVVATLPSTCVVAGVAALLGWCDAVGGFRNQSEARRLRLLGLRILHNWVFRGTIANSAAGVEFLAANALRPETIALVPNAIDPRTRARSTGRGSRGLTLITVATFSARKNLSLALQVVRRLRDRAARTGLDFRYRLVGYGSGEQDIVSQIRELGLTDCVQILGKDVNVEQTLSEADIYLSTSQIEGMSNSIMEAMAWELPVVATAVGGTTALVRDGETGFLRPPGDLDGLVEAVWALVTDREMCYRFGCRAKSLIEGEFSLEKLSLRVRSALAQLGVDLPVGRTADGFHEL